MHTQVGRRGYENFTRHEWWLGGGYEKFRLIWVWGGASPHPLAHFVISTSWLLDVKVAGSNVH